MLNEGIGVQPAGECFLCGSRGDVLYSGLRDRLFGAPGVWSLRRCPQCGLHWLDPRPIAADLGRLYSTYYTHGVVQAKLAGLRRVMRNSVLAHAFGYAEVGDGVAGPLLGAILSVLPPIRDRVGMSIAYLNGRGRGRLLDVGCGSGLFLGQMKQLGWQVEGVDPDPQAALIAREHYDVPVTVGDFTTGMFAPQSFDVVTLSHVIEHAIDPVELLRTCGAALRPNGRLVIMTPNIRSLGHLTKGKTWFPLDPPRHLFLFSVSTLSACIAAAGLRVDAVHTSARSAAMTWTASHEIANTGRGSLDIDTSLRFHPSSLVFQCREEIACARGKPVGEELMLTAAPASARG
jgi:2-polyprenyl-3-methyl-5-hydroxy-6-metoxy-1,4-benzoquinol methylase